MALKAVLEVAQQGKDLRTASLHEKALDSQLFLPKVYRVKELKATGSAITFAHGRGYAPMYLHYDEVHKSWTPSGGYVWHSPKRYAFNGYFNTIEVDSTNIYIGSGSWDNYIILFLDPLRFPTTHPSSTGHGGSPRIKVGDDLRGKADYLADIDSKYQTLKVVKTGQFVCSLPQWITTPTWGDAASTERTDNFSFNHNLGYPPAYTPFGIDRVGLSIDMAYNGWSNIPTDFIVNQAQDLWAERYLAFESSTNMETLKLAIDKDKYYMEYIRYAQDFGNSTTFPARTIRINYVIFDLPITTEFNLLS